MSGKSVGCLFSFGLWAAAIVAFPQAVGPSTQQTRIRASASRSMPRARNVSAQAPGPAMTPGQYRALVDKYCVTCTRKSMCTT